MTFEKRIGISSKGEAWEITPSNLGAKDGSSAGPDARAAAELALSADGATWSDLLHLYRDLTGDRYSLPTSADIDERIKPALRDAFASGRLIARPVAPIAKSRADAEKGAHGKKPDLEPPLPPPTRRPPPSTPKTLFNFAIRLVDELGAGIPGVDISFAYGSAKEKASTDGSGVARIEDSRVATAKATIADSKALRDAVKPRWDTPRGDRKRLDESDGATVVPLMGDDLPSFDLVADKVRIVSVQPYVARVRLIGGFFDTDKCFVLPRGLDGIRGVVRMYADHPKAKLLAVGHTDTKGKLAYNDTLSVERAEAAKDYLTDNVDGWYKWYETSAPVEKRWGSKEDQLMIGALSDAKERDADEDAVRWFQRTRGLTVDGIAGSATRHALIREYMELDRTSLPKGIEVVPHGCGENFPAKASGDNVEEDDNRRVEFFFFDGPLGVEPPPKGKNSGKGSTEYPEWVKRVKRNDDHVLVSGQAQFVLKRLLDDTPLAGALAQVQLPDGIVITQRADDKGVVRLDGVSGDRFRLLHVLEDPDRMTITSVGEPTQIPA